MSQWERNAARLASSVFSLSGARACLAYIWRACVSVSVTAGWGGRDKEQAGQTRVHISEAALDLLHRQV